MRNKYLPSIASFLIALIVSLPIYSSVVFASLSNPSIKGMDNIADYVKEPDTITISVNAEIAGDSEITPSQLHLGDPSQPNFDECTETATSRVFRCSYTSSDISATSNPFGILVRLYDDSDVENDRIRIEGYKDSFAPNIVSLTSSIIGSERIIFNYRIEDYIYNGSSGKCVGIKELILTSGTYSKIIPINSGQDNCIYEGSFTETINAITSLTSGNVIVEAKAYDAFGQQSSTAATSFIIDKIAPVIDTTSFKILYNNEEIHYFSGPISGAKASVEVEGADIATVTMDLSSIKESYPVRKANCNNGLCILNNVEIDLSSGGNYEIIINATDNLGNSRVESIYYNFIFDDEEPVPSPIKTNHADSRGNYYLGDTNNTIILEIEEAGVGFNNRNVYLNLRNINNNQNAQADDCIKESDILWRCYWRNVRVTASDGSKQISIIKSSSVDDLGNPITGEMAHNIIVDRTAPVINEITYSPAAPTSSDTIIFNIRFSDDSNEAKITIDSSSISSIPSHIGYCTTPDCSVNVGDIISSYVVAAVPITAEDPAGNIATKSSQVTILQADADSTPNFFSIKDIELIPSRIDKQVASQINMDIYVHITLQGAGSGSIISMKPDCTEMASYLHQDPYLMNEYGYNPYIVLKTNQNAANLDSLAIKCKLNLQVRDNERIYAKFEEESVEANVALYGNILGEMEDNLEEKLQGIENEIEDVEDEIDKWEKWSETFGAYCEIARKMGQLNQAMQALKMVGWIILAGAYTICKECEGFWLCELCMAIAWALWSILCYISNTVWTFTEGFFWPIGSQQSMDGWKILGWILKVSCMVFYYCALCDWDVVVQIGGSALTQQFGGSDVDDESKLNQNEDFELNQIRERSLEDVPNPSDPGGEARLSGSSIATVYDINQITGANSQNPDFSWAYNWIIDGKQTQLYSTFGGNYMFDPYESIHYAEKCMCLPALIYNLKKDRQIKCMYRNCIKNHLTSGQSVTVCDFAYKERECLYVESAQYLKHNYEGIFDNLISALLLYMESLLLGTVISFVCKDYVKPVKNVEKCPDEPDLAKNQWGPASVACGLLNTMVFWSEFDDISDSDFGGMGKIELEGEDYCERVDLDGF